MPIITGASAWAEAGLTLPQVFTSLHACQAGTTQTPEPQADPVLDSAPEPNQPRC